MDYYLGTKPILFLMTKMSGLMILRVSFFPMVHPNPVAYLASKSFVVKNKRNYDAGCILILDVTTDDIDYNLINIYYANTETE